ncbi:MAG: DUF2000 family protein [Gammaproteobacteria bacterium]
MFDTKIAIVVREDLESWRKVNVTAFVVSGLVGQSPDLVGESYVDAHGNLYNPLCVQPMMVLAADGPTLSKIHNRALNRGIRTSVYIEEMFATGHDAANREVFRASTPADANVVGLSLRAESKVVDKITKGARMHP